MSDSPLPAAQGSTEAGDAAQLLVTLFELGREVTSVLDLDELLEKIPQLIARLTPFKAFAVWLLDEKRQDLGIAYAVGYPEEVKRTFRLAVGQGIVGTVVAEGRSLVIDDVLTDPRYIGAMTDVRSQIAVPLRRKKRVIGALNLYGEHVGQFTPRDEAMLRQFGAHVAVAIENARLFEREKAYVDTLETLAEIGREVAAILDLEQLLERVATLVHKVVSYRTFGIFLLDERRGLLEQKLAIRYGDHAGFPHLKLGEGLIGHAAADKKVINVPDVTRDPRYLPWVEDCRSELAVPLLVKDRCIGVMDLESPDLDAFGKHDVEVLTALAARWQSPLRTRGCTRRFAPTRIASSASCSSHAACRRRCCRPDCPSECAAWMWPRTSRRRASWAATCTTSCRRSPTASSWPLATSRARECRRRFTACLRPNWSARGRSGAVTCPSGSARLAC